MGDVVGGWFTDINKTTLCSGSKYIVNGFPQDTAESIFSLATYVYSDEHAHIHGITKRDICCEALKDEW